LETGESAKVSDLNIVDGRVFGWLLEGAGSGAFEEARAWFSEGMRIIESVLIAESTADAAGDKGP
jgi:hypothetical protein